MKALFIRKRSNVNDILAPKPISEINKELRVIYDLIAKELFLNKTFATYNQAYSFVEDNHKEVKKYIKDGYHDPFLMSNFLINGYWDE